MANILENMSDSYDITYEQQNYTSGPRDYESESDVDFVYNTLQTSVTMQPIQYKGKTINWELNPF